TVRVGRRPARLRDIAARLPATPLTRLSGGRGSSNGRARRSKGARMFTTRTISFAALGLDRRGDLELSGELPPAPRVAIIGSRAAQRRCLVEVPAIVDAAHDLDHGVVSGGALGIDS